jgi:hypothetical protein
VRGRRGAAPTATCSGPHTGPLSGSCSPGLPPAAAAAAALGAAPLPEPAEQASTPAKTWRAARRRRHARAYAAGRRQPAGRAGNGCAGQRARSAVRPDGPESWLDGDQSTALTAAPLRAQPGRLAGLTFWIVGRMCCRPTHNRAMRLGAQGSPCCGTRRQGAQDRCCRARRGGAAAIVAPLLRGGAFAITDPHLNMAEAVNRDRVRTDHLDVVVGVPAGEARVGHAARPRADEGREGHVAAVECAGGVALGVVEVGGDAVEGVTDDGDVLDERCC